VFTCVVCVGISSKFLISTAIRYVDLTGVAGVCYACRVCAEIKFKIKKLKIKMCLLCDARACCVVFVICGVTCLVCAALCVWIILIVLCVARCVCAYTSCAYV